MTRRYGWFLLFAALCPAQSRLGSLQVRVADQSQSAVPGASLTLTKGPSAPKSGRTDIQGQYVFQNLEPGTYGVAVTARGFAPFELATLEVIAGRTQTLPIPLVLAVTTEKISVQDNVKVDVDPSNNASALVLRGAELAALSDNRDDLLVDLQALAGPAAGPNGGQIFIDGFTGGRLPPKQSIREVRINQNPFAAQFDRPGQGRIEIFTKPGTGEFHGQVIFSFSDAVLNSRNPFVDVRPPYRRRHLEGEFSGPLTRKTSFFFDAEQVHTNENAFINATILDRNLQAVPFRDAVVTPRTGIEANLKIDRQLTKNHTLTARYTHANDSVKRQGIGGFTLPARAFDTHDTERTWQVSETGVLNVHTINETRFRYRRQRQNQSGGTFGPAINVLDAFVSGGAPQAMSYNNQDRYELQNFTTIVHNQHTFRWGGLIRAVRLSDLTTQNYAGTFTFTSLASYRQTLLGLQNGLSAAQIRASGGGASQFSIAGGNPLAGIDQADFGLFLQDDWKLRPKLTVSGGLRYETQTNAGDRSNIAPRIGIAWGLGKAANKAPATVIRGGFGVFYDRLSESLSLDALRLDGIRQQQFLIPFPDFYPAIPSTGSLAANAQPQAIRKTDAQWRAPLMSQGAIGFDRQLPRSITVSANYIHSRGTRTLRSRNINAAFPGLGLHPYGGVNAIYLYETSGLYRQNQILANVNARISPKFTLIAYYAWGHARSNADGAGSFPANQYDLSSEYGRAGFDVRHRVQLNGSATLPWGVSVSPILTAASGRPVNFIIGRDLNQDSLFNDRPAFATDLSRPTVLLTRFGAFDTAPQPGQTIVPRNYGNGPAQVIANLRIGKTFTLGEKTAPGQKAASDPRKLTFSATSRNVINHPNFGNPNGNLSSPFFGRSTSLMTGGAGGNRRIDLQARFDF